MRPWASTISIEADSEQVWDLISHFQYWPRWGLSVQEVDPATGRITVGRRGRVRTAIGIWLPFEVTDVREGSSWAWDVAGVRATDHRVEPTSAGCDVTFIAPVWAPFYVPVLALSLRRLRRIAER